ncbi:MAG: hypothetical protein QOH69_2432 [Actinomycetota bacterium]|jgi:hypothetical protein|nr:hypothetical protein [Actinomycetota bacterium]
MLAEDYPSGQTTGVELNRSLAGGGDSQEAIAIAIAASKDWNEFRRHGDARKTPAEVREARRTIVGAWFRSLGVEDAAETVSKYGRERFDQLIQIAGRYDRFAPAPAPAPKKNLDIGEMWWAQTDYWAASSPIGTLAYFDSNAGGVNFVGQLDWDDGDLIITQLGLRATFGLGTDRLPAPGTYWSRPPSTLMGDITGFTGMSWPGFGDQWAKCWLNSSQTVRNKTGQILAQGAGSVRPVFLEDDGSYAVASLPGRLPLQDVSFDIVPGEVITITVEATFDIQLEGTSTIRFGNLGGLVPAFVRIPQWTLTPA